MRKTLQKVVCVALLLLAGRVAQAQHGHLNGGAVGTAQGDALTFVNGAIFAESSGYVKALTPTTTGARAGYYAGNITLTALPSTVANGGPAFGATANGSFLQYGIVSVSGPVGGQFGFWEAGAVSPTLSYASGFVAGVPTLIPLSDASVGAGNAGADPFGHLHGRNFTATAPGEYIVGFQLFDTSINGAGGGPIHSPSPVLNVKFAAVPEPGVIALLGLGVPLVLWGVVRRRS
jgi:hypothetical protein